jgi:N-acetylneuraminic acid mutarotase
MRSRRPWGPSRHGTPARCIAGAWAPALLLTMLGCNDESHVSTAPNAGPAGAAPPVALAVAARNTWLTRADMWGTERTGMAAAVVPDAAGQSVLYAIGGRTAAGGSLSRVMAYNAATNSWTLKAPLPVPLKQTNGAGVIGGKIYVSGGIVTGEKGYSFGLYVYNPATDTWARKRDLPTAGLNGLTVVIDNRLYVVTSCDDADQCNPPWQWLFRYDPGADTWMELATPSIDLFYYHRLVGGTISKKIYVGTPGSKTLDVYDPLTDTWTPRASSVAVRSGAASAVLGARLYMMGGARLNADGTATEVRTTNVYDPGTNTWTTQAALPTLRSAASAARIVVGGQARIELVGGSRPGNNLQYVP